MEDNGVPTRDAQFWRDLRERARRIRDASVAELLAIEYVSDADEPSPPATPVATASEPATPATPSSSEALPERDRPVAPRMVESHPDRFCFVTGKLNGVLQPTEPYRGVTVIGPVRSGKTTGIIVPAIARQRVRTITISVRADVINATLPSRWGTDPVWIIDPMGMLSSHNTTSWNPLTLCHGWDACVDFAYSFVMSAAMTGILDMGFWYAKAAQLLAPLLFAAAKNGYSMGDVARWVRDQDDFEVRALLQATGHDIAISSFESIATLEDRARGSIYTTLHASLRVFDSSQVVAATTGEGFDLDEFFASEAGVLYLAAPPHRQRQLAPLYSALINHVIFRAVEENLRTSVPADLLVLLDEAGNFPVPNLDIMATTAAGSGIQLVTVFHDVSQIVSLYGEARTQTILSNQSALLILPGARDARTAELVELLLAGSEIAANANDEISGAAFLRRMKKGTAIYFYDTNEPKEVKLQCSWDDDDLKEKLTASDEGIAWMLMRKASPERSAEGDIGGTIRAALGDRSKRSGAPRRA